MLRTTWRWLLVALGWVALAIGVLGIFLPLLPTTPFVLLAAFLFSKGSNRLHRWLAEHPRFGRYVREWEAERVIPPVGKYAATAMMGSSVTWVILTRNIPWPLEVLMAATMLAVLGYIWSRPSRPTQTVEGGRRTATGFGRPAPTRTVEDEPMEQET